MVFIEYVPWESSNVLAFDFIARIYPKFHLMSLNRVQTYFHYAEIALGNPQKPLNVLEFNVLLIMNSVNVRKIVTPTEIN